MLKTLTAETPGTAVLRVFGGTFLALGLLLACKAAVAEEPRCTTQSEITKQLEERYGEVPVSLGLSSAGKLVQVFSTEDGATWTLVFTQPDGLSCVVATGRYWQMATQKTLGPEA